MAQRPTLSPAAGGMYEGGGGLVPSPLLTQVEEAGGLALLLSHPQSHLNCSATNRVGSTVLLIPGAGLPLLSNGFREGMEPVKRGLKLC